MWAEDEESDRYLIRNSLPTGSQVEFVEDGQALLDALPAGRPRRVVLDLNMPRLSGREALERMRADPAFRDLPVSVFTGVFDPRVESLCRRLGVDPYVYKPIALVEFSSAVREALHADGAA